MTTVLKRNRRIRNTTNKWRVHSRCQKQHWCTASSNIYWMQMEARFQKKSTINTTEWGIRGLSRMASAAWVEQHPNVTLDQQPAVPIAVLTFYELFEIRSILLIPSRPRVHAFDNQFLYCIRKTRFKPILALIPWQKWIKSYNYRKHKHIFCTNGACVNTPTHTITFRLLF